MIPPFLRLWPFAVLLFALVAQAEEPFVLADSGERTAWEAIATRFSEGPAVKKERGVVEVSVKGLKPKPADPGMAAIRVDAASGHVVEVVANGGNFTDDEFALFAKFPELRALTLWHNHGAGFDGTGLAHVLALTKLEKVTLAGGSLSDAGLAQLAKIATLREFHAWHAAYTDAGVAALRKHPALEAFRVGPQWKPTFTDQGLASLATCPKLARVGVDETWLTWEGSLHFLADRRDTLRTIDLGSCLIDPADVDRLRASLPKVTIQWKGLAAAGALFRKQPNVRASAEKWMPKELVARAVSGAEKAELAPPAPGKP